MGMRDSREIPFTKIIAVRYPPHAIAVIRIPLNKNSLHRTGLFPRNDLLVTTANIRRIIPADKRKVNKEKTAGWLVKQPVINVVIMKAMIKTAIPGTERRAISRSA